MGDLLNVKLHECFDYAAGLVGGILLVILAVLAIIAGVYCYVTVKASTAKKLRITPNHD